MTGLICPEWIAVDWGTSNLRAWAMGQEGVLAEASSEDGMSRLSQADFEPALLRLVAPWLTKAETTVIACGMVGSRQGWHEAPYRATPCAPILPGALVQVPTIDKRVKVLIAPGVKQTNPADVMRGEETQIAGALALCPDFDGVLCLPGTHTKWAHVSAGEIVSFQTFMTGEMFDLLSRHSVLRHGMTDGGWEDASFLDAVSDALSRPERIAARLFSLRAEGLIAGLSSQKARARLSGLLIGIELAGAKPYWLGRAVALIGSEGLSRIYARALEQQGITAQILPGTACTIAGLASLAPQCEITR